MFLWQVALASSVNYVIDFSKGIGESFITIKGLFKKLSDS